MILGMFFLKISNADVSFGEETLIWRTCITNEALPITEQIQIIKPKKFIIVALDIDSKTFVMHMAI